MSAVRRLCVRCDDWYPSGAYGAHRAAHVPVRTNTAGPKPQGHHEVLRLYAEVRSYAEVARRTGLTRQRVHQIVKRALNP